MLCKHTYCSRVLVPHLYPMLPCGSLICKLGVWSVIREDLDKFHMHETRNE